MMHNTEVASVSKQNKHLFNGLFSRTTSVSRH